MDLFDVIPAFEALKVTDVEEVLKNHFKKEALSVCQVQKKKS
jgi:hypothetical protein